MNDLYGIFGLTSSCTDEELEQKYEELKKKYSEDRFLEGDAGNAAAKKLTEIETAYAEIKSERSEKNFSSEQDSGLYREVEDLIKNGDLTSAQDKLDAFNERGAEWHYLQSVLFYKKNWLNESKKQLEIAMQMDGNNQKYKNSYEKLVNKIKSDSDKTFTGYSGDRGNAAPDYGDQPQMGGNYCLEWCCEMAICNAMLNCCCNCR